MDEDARKGNIYAYTIDGSHGRIEKRECFVCNDIGWLNNRDKWADLHGIGMIIATIEATPNNLPYNPKYDII